LCGKATIKFFSTLAYFKLPARTDWQAGWHFWHFDCDFAVNYYVTIKSYFINKGGYLVL